MGLAKRPQGGPSGKKEEGEGEGMRKGSMTSRKGRSIGPIIACIIVLGGSWLGLAPTRVKAQPAHQSTTRTVRLRSGDLTLEDGLGSSLSRRLERETGHPVHFLFEGHHAQSPLDVSELGELGVRLLSPLSKTVWIASTDSGVNLEAPAIASRIRSASLLPSELKLHPSLSKSISKGGRLAVTVILYRDNPARTAPPQLSHVKWTSDRTLQTVLDSSQISDLARDDQILWIEPHVNEHQPLNQEMRVAIRADRAQNADLDATPPTYALSGKGVTVAVFDTGIDDDHGDFTGRMLRNSGSGTHGTHVGGILGGSGRLSSLYGNGGSAYEWRGVAPSCKLASFDISINHDDYQEAVDVHGAQLSNNSFVQALLCEYDADAMLLDELVRGSTGKPLSIVFAAGNNGTSAQYGPLRGYFSTFTSAKNTISVGSIHADDGRRSGFSSLGPTYDGRIKPDLVAPGSKTYEGILSTFPRDRYGAIQGTSMAAPAVAGSLALLYQAYGETYQVDINEAPPLASTLKAVLIQTAEDLIHETAAPEDVLNPDTGEATLYSKGPDFATGWGLIDVEAASILIQEKRIQELKIGLKESERNYTFMVPAGRDEVKVTLAWDDPAANPISALDEIKLINDLDIVLIDPLGERHLPWVLDPLAHESLSGNRTGIDPLETQDILPARRGVDTRNNVEQVLVEMPIPGLWTLRIHASRMATDQIVSLAASEPLPRIDANLSCPETTDGELVTITASLLHHESVRRPVTTTLSVVDSQGGGFINFRTFSRNLPKLAQPEKTLTLSLPRGVPTNEELTLWLRVKDTATGEELARASCTFQILD